MKRNQEQASFVLTNSSNSQITSLQSIITNTYINSLNSSSGSGSPFINNIKHKKANKCAHQKSKISYKTISFSPLSFDNSNNHNKSVSDFKYNTSSQLNSMSNFSNQSSRSNFTTTTNSFQSPYATTSQLLLRKYYLQEKANTLVSCKKDVHKKIIGSLREIVQLSSFDFDWFVFFWNLEIGENIFDKIRANSQLDLEKKLSEKEFDLKQFYDFEMEAHLEKERAKFAAKLDTLKSQMKKEYEKLLKVWFDWNSFINLALKKGQNSLSCCWYIKHLFSATIFIK